MDYLTIASLLIVFGVVLLIAEILMPTGGFLVVGALLFFGLGIGTILYYGETIEAVVAMGGLAVLLPASAFAAVHAWQRLSIGSTLDAAASSDALEISGLAALKGRVGKAISPMRPSGTVDFDGRRVDAMTEGTMIDDGTWVRCVYIKGGRVIVRQMEGPSDISEINPGGSAPQQDKDFDDFDLDFNKP